MHVFVWKKAGNGPYDRSKNMGPNYGNFWRFWAVRDSPEICCGLIVWTLCIKFCFGVYKIGNW